VWLHADDAGDDAITTAINSNDGSNLYINRIHNYAHVYTQHQLHINAHTCTYNRNQITIESAYTHTLHVSPPAPSRVCHVTHACMMSRDTRLHVASLCHHHRCCRSGLHRDDGACAWGLGGSCTSGAACACVTHVTRHASHVTHHTSHVTRHTSHVTRHPDRAMHVDSRQPCLGVG